MGILKNANKTIDGLGFFLQTALGSGIEDLREIVWTAFCRILENTPQYTGKAVANWNLSIGEPDYTYDESVGEKGTLALYLVGHKGDQEWVEYAKFKNAGRIAELTYDPVSHRVPKVYITNAVQGDDDHGKSSVFYLESLQDPAYWAVKLRAANQPYETAQESMLLVSQQFAEDRGKLFRSGGSYRNYT